MSLSERGHVSPSFYLDGILAWPRQVRKVLRIKSTKSMLLGRSRTYKQSRGPVSLNSPFLQTPLEPRISTLIIFKPPNL